MRLTLKSFAFVAAIAVIACMPSRPATVGAASGGVYPAVPWDSIVDVRGARC